MGRLQVRLPSERVTASSRERSFSPIRKPEAVSNFGSLEMCMGWVSSDWLARANLWECMRVELATNSRGRRWPALMDCSDWRRATGPNLHRQVELSVLIPGFVIRVERLGHVSGAIVAIIDFSRGWCDGT